MPDRQSAIRFLEDAAKEHLTTLIAEINEDSDLEERGKGTQRRLARADHAEAVRLLKEMKREFSET